MRRAAALAAVVLLVGCTGDDPTPASVARQDGGTGPGQDGGGGSPTAAQHLPSSVTFVDGDPAKGQVDGTVVVGPAADESDVDAYVLYWGSDATTKLLDHPALATLPKGAPLEYKLGGPVPAGATQLLAFTKNAVGESASAVATTADNFAQFVDISAGAGDSSGNAPSAAIDAASGKLLVVAGASPGLFRSGLDGQGAAFVDISGGNGGATPSLAIDAAGGKLLAVVSASFAKPALIRCALDGTGCTFTDVSTGQGTSSGQNPRAVVDAKNGKLLAVTQDGGNPKPGLFRCALDGTGCAFVDISAGQAAGSGYGPSAVIDTANDKLLVAVTNSNNNNKLGLFRCALDGTGCTYTDISAGQGANSGGSPSAVIDAANNKLLVAVTNGADNNKLGLVRCNLDGTGCTFADLSAGQAAQSGTSPSAAVDAVGGKLYVATTNAAVSSKAFLFRANLDGTSATAADISAGRGVDSGHSPSLVIGGTPRRALVVASDANNGSRLALYSIGVW